MIHRRAGRWREGGRENERMREEIEKEWGVDGE